MAARMANPYDPPIGIDCIRLFRIGIARDGLVSVELRRFPLEGQECPPFVATSYVWGAPTYTGTVLLNDQPTSVLQSALGFLEAMLSERRRAKFPPYETWWWMDSICINQEDDEERSAQVQLMSIIYTRAKETAIWLGEESEDSNQGMEFLHTLAHQDFYKHPSEDVSGMENDNQGWAAVEHLLLREWFERGWTLQEFLLGRHATFFCGDKKITRRGMFSAISRLWDWQQWKFDIIPRKSYEKAWNRFRMLERYQHEHSLPLIGTLAYTATFRVTNPRDRLYSLLGLTNTLDRKAVGRPDYESDPTLVYAKFVRSFVEVHGSLDIVCLAAVLRRDGIGDGEENGYDLPSWVPDWSIRLLHSGPVPCMASQSSRTHIGNFRPLHSMDSSAKYAASGEMGPANVSFSGDMFDMTCCGIVLDQVDGLGGVRQVRQDPLGLVQSTSVANARSRQGFQWTTEEDISSIVWDKVPRCMVLDRHDRYLRHPAPVADFSRQFMILCQVAMQKPEAMYPPMAEWLEDNKHLLIHGTTLEEAIMRCGRGSVEEQPFYVKALSKLRRTAEQGVFNWAEISKALEGVPGASDWQGFLSRSRDTTVNMGMRLMVTDSGLLGMAPREARKGDVVCVLFGCSIPLVLREVPGSGPDPDRQAFEVIGECFMAGYMNGEILKDITLERRDFRLV